MSTRDLQAVLAFLREIGLECRHSPGAHGFVAGVRIEQGALLVDPGAKVSDLLHEAGHLAVFPARFRALVSGNIDKGAAAMFEQLGEQEPDGPEMIAALQCGDAEATAWAWAAGVHLGLPPEVIIEDQDYGGGGALQRLMLSGNGHLGIHGITHAGFCATRPGAYARMRGLPAYPQLKQWLQGGRGERQAPSERADSAAAASAASAQSEPEAGSDCEDPVDQVDAFALARAR